MEMEPWNNQEGCQTVQELVQQSDEGNHVLLYNQTDWETSMSYHHHHQGSFDTSLPESPYHDYHPISTDLLPNPQISFANAARKSNLFASLGQIGDLSSGNGMLAPSVVYDPLMASNLPLQPPMLRDLFQSLPQGYYSSLGGCSRSGSLFSGIDTDGDTTNGGVYQNGVWMPFTEGVFELTSVNDKDGRKDTKHFATEKQRRVHLNDKYQALKDLVPNPTKGDKASIVGDAIGYIEELKRTVNNLKILVEKKRNTRERMKRHKKEEGAESIKLMKTEDSDDQYSSALRSSWLHRKSKNTEVDVRIIDDEVTVKLVQQKRVNCLLFVSKVFDELQLEFHHVAGGLIGDYYSFLFNSKIREGSTIYAQAIANMLIGAADKQYAAVSPSIS